MKDFIGTFLISIVVSYIFAIFFLNLILTNIWAMIILGAFLLSISITAFMHHESKIEELEKKIKELSDNK